MSLGIYLLHKRLTMAARSAPIYHKDRWGDESRSTRLNRRDERKGLLRRRAEKRIEHQRRQQAGVARLSDSMHIAGRKYAVAMAKSLLSRLDVIAAPMFKRKRARLGRFIHRYSRGY